MKAKHIKGLMEEKKEIKGNAFCDRVADISFNSALALIGDKEVGVDVESLMALMRTYFHEGHKLEFLSHISRKNLAQALADNLSKFLEVKNGHK